MIKNFFMLNCSPFSWKNLVPSFFLFPLLPDLAHLPNNEEGKQLGARYQFSPAIFLNISNNILNFRFGKRAFKFYYR